MKHNNICQLGGCSLGCVVVLHCLPISASSSAERCFLSQSGALVAPIGVDLGGALVSVFAPPAVVRRAPSQGLWARASKHACDTGYPLAFGLGVYGELTLSNPALAASPGDRGCTSMLATWRIDAFGIVRLLALPGCSGAAISRATCITFW